MGANQKIQLTFNSKWLLVISLSVLILLMFFCCFYLFSGYHYLAAWYLKMNSCFYRQPEWQGKFFTLQTKKQGNIFCTSGLAVGCILLYQVIKRLKKQVLALKLQFNKRDLFMVLAAILTGSIAWIWGYSLVYQGFDEVFSAVNCASLPPFQTLSYYMLPNNHILFNVLNGVLFSFADDKVFTGKLLSLFCCWGIIIVIFSWLKGIIKNKVVLLIATIILSLQFPIWGFGFQARGYEFCSLVAWVAFFSLLRYINTKNSHWLYYYVLASITGYFCIPVFLYFHAACMLFGLFWVITVNSFDVKFWKAQAVIIITVFLLYLPALCFSGLHALAGNQYVSGQIHNLHDFFHEGFRSFKGYLSFYTSSFTANHRADWVLFFVALYPVRLLQAQTGCLVRFFLSVHVAGLCCPGLCNGNFPDRPYHERAP